RALVGRARRARAVPGAVPSAAFELERVAAHDLRHLAAALLAGVGRRIGQLLQALDDVAACLADELVDRHDAKISTKPSGRAALFKLRLNATTARRGSALRPDRCAARGAAPGQGPSYAGPSPRPG